MVQPEQAPNRLRGRQPVRQVKVRTRLNRSRSPLYPQNPDWNENGHQKVVVAAESGGPQLDHQSSQLLRPDLISHSVHTKPDPPPISASVRAKPDPPPILHSVRGRPEPPIILREEPLDYEVASTSPPLIDLEEDAQSVGETIQLDEQSVCLSSDEEYCAPRLPQIFPTYNDAGSTSSKPIVYSYEPNLMKKVSLDLQTPTVSPEERYPGACDSPGLPADDLLGVCNKIQTLVQQNHTFVQKNYESEHRPVNPEAVALTPGGAQLPSCQVVPSRPVIPEPQHQGQAEAAALLPGGAELLPPPALPPRPAPHRPRGEQNRREEEFPLQKPKKKKRVDKEKRDKVRKQVLSFKKRYLEPRDYRSPGDPPGTCRPYVPCVEGPPSHKVSSVYIGQFVQAQWCHCSEGAFRRSQCSCDSSLQDILLRMQISTNSVKNANIMDQAWP